MTIDIQKSTLKNNQSIQITGSKSESNRLLLLQALYPEITIKNVSNSDDSKVMQKALRNAHLSSSPIEVDIHHAGTAMRFLTAYFAIQNGQQTLLTGSSRMKERPIGILVDALRTLGADIQYIENDGFPPLLITGKTLLRHHVTLKANISSQYISALALIGSRLEKGITIRLDGVVTSLPYINMTLSLLNTIGITAHFKDNTIIIAPQTSGIASQTITVESDWSSASYFYSIIALSHIGTEVTLASYKTTSLQGDAVLADIYTQFGVETTFNTTTITLRKVAIPNSQTQIQRNLSNAPDIAQTIAVTAFGLGVSCYLTGLHTLKIKETDRLVALENELSKFGADITITEDALQLSRHQMFTETHQASGTGHTSNVAVATYNDHRMAMAFAPLALKTNFVINDADVVSKSYPDFWKDLSQLGVTMTIV